MEGLGSALGRLGPPAGRRRPLKVQASQHRRPEEPESNQTSMGRCPCAFDRPGHCLLTLKSQTVIWLAYIQSVSRDQPLE